MLLRAARSIGLVLVLALLCAPWVNVPADNADSAGMQAHLYSLFEARDLLYDDDYAALGMSPLFAFVTERGVVSNHWPAGASFVQLPGWWLGRVAGESLVGEGVSARAAVWTIPLLGVRCWALLVWVWLGARVFGWLRRRVERGTAALASAALLLGTPALAYASEYPVRPHLWGAVFVALALMRWWDAVEHAREDPERAAARWERALELAAYVGLATAIRPQLAPLALLVAHERIYAARELDLGGRLRTILGHGLVSAGVFALWPALVVRMQLWMYGNLGDYAAGGELSHHLRAFLLSTHHGALLWCPVLVLGVLGLAIGAAERQPGALLLLGLMLLQVWLDAGTREIEPYHVLGTRTWTGGTSFGPRKLLDAIPLMLPGVVWLSTWLAGQEPLEASRWRRRLAAASSLALVPTLLLLAAAFIDHRTCSLILDPEHYLIALGLAFDPSAWSLAWAQRSLPSHVVLRVALVAGLPLAMGVVATLRARGKDEPRSLAGPLSWRRRAAASGFVVYGVIAHLWLSQLQANSATRLAAEPQRMQRAAAQLNPWHEAVIAQIPAHHEELREHLGPEAAPP